MPDFKHVITGFRAGPRQKQTRPAPPINSEIKLRMLKCIKMNLTPFDLVGFTVDFFLINR